MTDEEFAKLFPGVKWPKTAERRNRTQIVPPLPSSSSLPQGFFDIPLSKDPDPFAGKFRNSVPTPREKLAYFLTDTFFGDDRAGLDRAEFLLRPIDVSPAAIPFAGYDATRAVGEGRYKDAILPTITAVAPFVGKPVKALTGVKPIGPGESFVESFPNSVEVPATILNAERRITKNFDQTITNNTDQAFGNGSNKIGNVGGGIDPSDGIRKTQSAERIPEQTFLTEGLERKRHNYPPNQTITDDASTTSSNGTPMMWDESRKPVAIRLHDPRPTPQRPFEADYPKTPAHDESGWLSEDIDGDPITAPNVAGRQTLGGDDVGFNAKQFWETARKLAKIEIVPRKTMIDPVTGHTPFGESFVDENGIRIIRVAAELPERHMVRVVAHEMGHTAHRMAGFPPIDPIMRAELEPTYSRFRNGIESPEKLTLPRNVSVNYHDPVVSDQELVAEGFYKAFGFPNEAKKELPIFYKTLRQWIKKDPELAKLLINNSIVATTAAAALGATGELSKAEAAPPPNPQGKLLGTTGAHPSAVVPLGSGNKATNGWGELTRALSRRGPYPQAPRREKYTDLVRALVNLKAQRQPQPYGGPR